MFLLLKANRLWSHPFWRLRGGYFTCLRGRRGPSIPKSLLLACNSAGAWLQRWNKIECWNSPSPLNAHGKHGHKWGAQKKPARLLTNPEHKQASNQWRGQVGERGVKTGTREREMGRENKNCSITGQTRFFSPFWNKWFCSANQCWQVRLPATNLGITTLQSEALR